MVSFLQDKNHVPTPSKATYLLSKQPRPKIPEPQEIGVQHVVYHPAAHKQIFYKRQTEIPQNPIKPSLNNSLTIRECRFLIIEYLSPYEILF